MSILDFKSSDFIDIRPRSDVLLMYCMACKRNFKLAVRIDYNSRGKKKLVTKLKDCVCYYCNSSNIYVNQELGDYC